jgi:hypothetical protein
MKFSAKSEKEILDELFWPRGTYEFEVVDARDQTSAAGNEMIKVRLRVFCEGHEPIIVTDYLMAKRPLKLRHAAVTCGLRDKYIGGSLCAADFTGRRGKCKLVVDRQWGANKVSDYC